MEMRGEIRKRIKPEIKRKITSQNLWQKNENIDSTIKKEVSYQNFEVTG